jgi:hypothetical protein
VNALAIDLDVPGRAQIGIRRDGGHRIALFPSPRGARRHGEASPRALERCDPAEGLAAQ